MSTAHYAFSKIGGTYEYSYDATNLIVKVYTKTELASIPTTLSVATLIPYNLAAPGGSPDNWYALWCKMDLDSDSKFSTTVTVYDTQKDIASLAAKDFDDATDGFGAAHATPKYKANTAKTDPGSKAMTPEATANPKIADYSVLWGAQDTWAQLSNDKKTFECQISFKRESLAGTAAKDQFTIIEGQKANIKNSYYTNISALVWTS